MYFHVRITQKSNKRHDETKLDLSEEQLIERVIKPYESDEPIIINGKTISGNDIERIRITQSNEKSEILIQQVRYERTTSSVMVVGGMSIEWLAADKAKNVTDEYITHPPGYRKVKSTTTTKGKNSKNKVFIVHGHDYHLKNDLEAFLNSIGIKSIVLHREADEGLTIIEKFEKHSDVQFAFILLTTDDISYSVKDIKKQEKDRNNEYRARQNVIFEFGYFVGKLGRSATCCIYKEGVTLPTDISGLLYKEVKTKIEDIGYSIIKELKSAGLEPEL